MRIKLIQIGKTKDDYVKEGVEEFIKRLRPFSDLEIVDIKKQKNVEEEGEKILKAMDKNAVVIVLDEHGKQFDSVEFAALLKKEKDRGGSINFVIGGAYGLAKSVKARADIILSMSKMTFTHQMIRLFLLEQLYRGVCIFSGKEYHNE